MLISVDINIFFGVTKSLLFGSSLYLDFQLFDLKFFILAQLFLFVVLKFAYFELLLGFA